MDLTNDELIRIIHARLSQQHEREPAVYQELRRVSEKLKRSEALKSNFLSNIKNEINNPISSALGLSHTLMKNGMIDQVQLKRLGALIYNEVSNLDFQMKNIFVAAEIESGELNPVASLVDVRMLMTDLQHLLTFKSEQKGIAILCNISAQESDIFCTDAYIVHLIVVNIVSNAIEFGKPGTTVTINLTIDEKRLHLSVADCGNGIDQESQSKIFERFFQVDQSTTKKHAGQGLGLAIVKELISLLQGELTIESAPGSGSVFSISIPALSYDDSMPAQSESWNDFMFDQKEEIL